MSSSALTEHAYNPARSNRRLFMSLNSLPNQLYHLLSVAELTGS